MSEHAHEDRVRAYLLVFGALLVLTVVTVAVSYFHMPRALGVLLGLMIATVKAGLVAAFFMHLKWERPLIYGLLGLTAFFALFLFALPIYDSGDTHGVREAQPVVMPGRHAAEGGAHAEPAH